MNDLRTTLEDCKHLLSPSRYKWILGFCNEPTLEKACVINGYCMAMREMGNDLSPIISEIQWWLANR